MGMFAQVDLSKDDEVRVWEMNQVHAMSRMELVGMGCVKPCEGVNGAYVQTYERTEGTGQTQQAVGLQRVQGRGEIRGAIMEGAFESSICGTETRPRNNSGGGAEQASASVQKHAGARVTSTSSLSHRGSQVQSVSIGESIAGYTTNLDHMQVSERDCFLGKVSESSIVLLFFNDRPMQKQLMGESQMVFPTGSR